jgi:glutaredoxin
MKVEYFSAECKICQRTYNIIQHHFPELDIEKHNAADCIDGKCCELAEQYNVRAVPSLVVDGNVIQIGMPSDSDIERIAKILN